MERETPHDESVRLRKAQIKALQNEVYGGLSKVEKAEYDSRAERIRELERREIDGASARMKLSA